MNHRIDAFVPLSRPVSGTHRVGVLNNLTALVKMGHRQRHPARWQKVASKSHALNHEYSGSLGSVIDPSDALVETKARQRLRF